MTSGTAAPAQVRARCGQRSTPRGNEFECGRCSRHSQSDAAVTTTRGSSIGWAGNTSVSGPGRKCSAKRSASGETSLTSRPSPGSAPAILCPFRHCGLSVQSTRRGRETTIASPASAKYDSIATATIHTPALPKSRFEPHDEANPNATRDAQCRAMLSSLERHKLQASSGALFGDSQDVAAALVPAPCRRSFGSRRDRSFRHGTPRVLKLGCSLDSGNDVSATHFTRITRGRHDDTQGVRVGIDSNAIWLQRALGTQISGTHRSHHRAS